MAEIFVDANVIIEVLMGRDKYEASRAILAGDDTYYISALTVHIIWYIAEKYHLDNVQVKALLSSFLIIPLDVAALQMANQRYDGKVFEDCLQAACAELGKCDVIVTLDKQFAKHSGTKLPVQTLA